MIRRAAGSTTLQGDAARQPTSPLPKVSTVVDQAEVEDAVAPVLASTRDLISYLDQILVVHDTASAPVSRVDWAYYRLATVELLIRTRCGGTVPASLARSLFEEAALWDWGLNRAIGTWPDDWADVEIQRLTGRADPTDDIWLRWLVPPNAQISPSGIGIAEVDDAVKRIGTGLPPKFVQTFQVTGLYGAYRLIGVLNHGGPAAALLAASWSDAGLPAPFAAMILQVVSGAAASLASTQLQLTAHEVDQLLLLAEAVARCAGAVHGASTGPLVSRTAAKGKKAQTSRGTSLDSTIGAMPPATQVVRDAAREFVEGALAVEARVIQLGPPLQDPIGYIGLTTFALASDHLAVLQGATSGDVADALVPFAARSLFEEGARWGWLAKQSSASSGSSARALFGEAQFQLAAARQAMLKEGISPEHVDAWLAAANPVASAGTGDHRLPSIDSMLDVAYAVDERFTAFARPMYSILSQFIHGTPIAVMHLSRSTFPSLSAPTFAVSVHAACFGYWWVAKSSLALAFGPKVAELNPEFQELAHALAHVRSTANAFHFLE